MAVEIAIWRMTDAGPHRLASSPLDFEQRLEDMLSEDPSMSGTELFVGELHRWMRQIGHDGRDYLARTWLLDPQQTEDKAVRPSRRKSRPWNGRDFYMVLGRADQTDRWAIASKYGLLNAGGGSWYWKPLRNLTPGKRVFAYVGGAGYVGIGRVTGEMIPARDAKVEVAGQLQSLLDQPERSAEGWEQAASDDPEKNEMVVPVEWLATRPIDQAVREKGLFASQVTVCKLRDEHTIKTVERAFGLDPAID